MLGTLTVAFFPVVVCAPKVIPCWLATMYSELGFRQSPLATRAWLPCCTPSARVLLVAQANEDKIAVVGVGKARHAQHGVAVEMADTVNDLDPFILHVVVVAGFVLDVPVEGQVELWSAGCERRRDGERFTVL